MRRPVRVGPSTASGLPGDEARILSDPLDDGVAIEPDGPGRWVIHAAEATDTRAWTGQQRSGLDGVATVEVVVDGWRFEIEVEDAARWELRRRATRDRESGAASGPTEVRAIIPGRVAAVRVVAGDTVEAGASLLVIEAMKMQNDLRAPRAGTVERVAVGEGQTIDNGDLLVVLA